MKRSLAHYESWKRLTTFSSRFPRGGGGTKVTQILHLCPNGTTVDTVYSTVSTVVPHVVRHVRCTGTGHKAAVLLFPISYFLLFPTISYFLHYLLEVFQKNHSFYDPARVLNPARVLLQWIPEKLNQWWIRLNGNFGYPVRTENQRKLQILSWRIMQKMFRCEENVVWNFIDSWNNYTFC